MQKEVRGDHAPIKLFILHQACACGGGCMCEIKK